MTTSRTPEENLPAEKSADAVSRDLSALVERSQKVMAHAWMVRTFVKHSDEVEDFPELNEMARMIFDVFRALETQVGDPAAYFRIVRKKLGKLRAAAEQFEKDAWHASTHTNFQQAAISARFIGEQLHELLVTAEAHLPRRTSTSISLPRSSPVSSSLVAPPRTDSAAVEVEQTTPGGNFPNPEERQDASKS